MGRIIAISDIHGHLHTFKALIMEQLALTKDDQLFLLGDYIDRGPASKEVLDFIMYLQENGYQVNCLLGNHEQMMIESYQGSRVEYSNWLWNGGEDTMRSFRVKNLEEIPDKYWQFLDSLPCFIETEEYIFVHAGINFRSPEPFEDFESMLWIRKWYQNINPELLNGKMIVHGHTPIEKGNIIAKLDNVPKPFAVNIDSGCYFYGDLCAIDLTSRTLYFQKNIDI